MTTRLRTPLLLLAALVAGCGTGALDVLPGDRLDRTRMYDVAADEDASATEIVEAGRAVDAARSGETVLVAYTVHSDDDQGRSAAAWRLSDADGDPIADGFAGTTDEGFAHPLVLGLPDGYLLQPEGGAAWHVAPDGTLVEVRRVRGAARAGDVPLGGLQRAVYRPRTATIVAVVPRAPRNPQGWTVAGDGTVWTQGSPRGAAGPVPFARSRDGRPWQPVAPYHPGARRSVAFDALTAVGDQVTAVVLAHGSQPDQARLAGVLTRFTAGAASGRWELLPVRDAAGRDWWDAHATAVDDDTLLVGTWGEAPYAVSLRDGTARQLELPTDEEGWVLEAQAGSLYATHPAHADAWVFEEVGADWERLPH